MMNRKIVKYYLIRAEPEIFIKKVNEYIQMGWQPFGSYSDVCANGKWWDQQVMVKYEEVMVEYEEDKQLCVQLNSARGIK